MNFKFCKTTTQGKKTHARLGAWYKKVNNQTLNQNFLIRVCASCSSVPAVNKFLLPVKVFSPESHQIVIGGVEITFRSARKN